MHRSSAALLVFVSTAALATASWAAGPAPMPAPPPVPAAPTQIPGLPTPPPEPSDPAPSPKDQSLLGPSYENQAAGIAFRAPADTVQVPKAPGDAELAEFYDQKRGWDFKVALSRPGQPTALTQQTDPDGVKHPGLLQLTLNQVKTTNPGAEVLRSDVTNIGDADVGMIALRYTQGTQRKLTQLAIIQKSKYLFYIFNLTTPGAPTKQQAATQPAAAQDDPTEVAAVHTFTQVLDSLTFLDQAAIREDQVQRLFRTRNLFRNWTTARVNAALTPQQWLRVVRDGKDVGYSYIVERPEHRGNAEGILIGVRSRMRSTPETTVDSEVWMYSNIDRKHESWSNVVRISKTADPAKATNYATEIGSSDALLESHPLTVKTVGKNGNADPLERELPPWYLPQAVSHLLPRLIPLHEAKTYMFANYVPDQRQVMSRYVEVQRERDITLDGKHLRAIPISDRLGLQGVPTYHYFTPDGRYLGSETTVPQQSPGEPTPREVKLLILPTTAEQLNQIWDKPNLTAPSAPPPQAPENVQPKSSNGR